MDRKKAGFSADRPSTIKCARCGSDQISTRQEKDTFTYGKDKDAVRLVADVAVHSCAACGFEFLDSAAEDAYQKAVCEHLGVMSPDEIQRLRQSHGSRVEFAQLTGIAERTLARWENGELLQTMANDNFLYLLSFPDNCVRLRYRRYKHSTGSTDRFTRLKQNPEITERANTFKLSI